MENKVITELKAEIVALKKSLDKEKRALSSMQSKKDSIINKQVMNIKNLEEKIAMKDKTIKDRAETAKESKQRGFDRVKEINLQLTQEKEKNVVKEAKINSLNETIKSNQEKIREKEEEIKKLKNNQDNTEKRDETNKDTTDNVATPHELNKLKVELEEKEKTIQFLNEKLETYNNLARNNREFLLQNELKKKTNCIKDLESTIQQYKDKITELEGIIQSQESKYANMEENMKKVISRFVQITLL